MKIERIITECEDLIIELHGEFDALGSAEIRPELEALGMPIKVLDEEGLEVQDPHQ